MCESNKLKTTSEYNEELGTSYCYIETKEYPNQIFIGEATCCEADKDMQSEITGGEIAYRRAYLNYLKYVLESDLKPQAHALKQLYYSMNHSKKFNELSYEARRIRRHRYLIQKQINELKMVIADERQFLFDYIKKKDTLYAKIRKERNNKAESK